MRDRSTHVDLALAFAATFVITLALWPRTTPRQIVRCNSAESGWKTYSIDVDDPSLAKLKQQIDQWKTPESHPAYVTAKWQKEVAEFYENCKPCEPSVAPSSGAPAKEAQRRSLTVPLTATISDTVIIASYETNDQAATGAVQPAAFVEPAESTVAVTESEAQADDDAPIASPSDANYWSTVKASAAQSMATIEARSANVPVVFEGTVPSTWPQLAFHCAFLFGIAAACGYMHWILLAPIRRGVPFRDQPNGVLARIGTFGGVIVLALISSVVVWI